MTVKDKGVVLRLFDGTGWTCDVPVSAAKWARYKRMARKEHMRLATWLPLVLHVGLASLIAKHRPTTPLSKDSQEGI